MPTRQVLVAILFCAGCTLPVKFDPLDKSGSSSEFTELTDREGIRPEWMQPTSKDYTLGPGDKLDIEILAEDGTRAATFVTPDGKIYYSLLEGLDVKGKTLARVKQELETNLRALYKRPQVSVTLMETSSQRVWVLGRINRPGNYPIKQPMRVLDAISLAGGLFTSDFSGTSEELADLAHSFIRRGNKLMPVNFQKLLRDGDLSQNIYLEPNDFIYLPSSMNSEVYVLGAVSSPRPVAFMNEMNLMGAIGRTQGTLPQADIDHVTIVRGSLTEPKYAVVSLRKIMSGAAPNILLQPGDIIHVPMPDQISLFNYSAFAADTFQKTVGGGNGGDYARLAVSTFTRNVAGREGAFTVAKKTDTGTTTGLGLDGKVQTVIPFDSSGTQPTTTGSASGDETQKEKAAAPPTATARAKASKTTASIP